MNAIREAIKDVLGTIASKEEQYAYRENVPIANVPAELICMWFDDCYHPGSNQHKDAFSTEEQEILSEFDNFYRARKDRLSSDFDELQKSPQWDEVVNAARKALYSIKW